MLHQWRARQALAPMQQQQLLQLLVLGSLQLAQAALPLLRLLLLSLLAAARPLLLRAGVQVPQMSAARVRCGTHALTRLLQTPWAW